MWKQMETEIFSDRSQEEKEAENSMGSKCTAIENVKILLCHRALHVGYVS